MKVAVVILNWNGKKLLEQFLPTVIKYSKPFAEIIVADNASTDDSIAFLNKNYSDITIIRNAENYGFAKGYNEALSQIEADYFVLLNSDIEVTPHWLEGVVEFMESHDDVAACQPKILSQKEKHLFEYAGAAGGFIDKLGYPFCRGRIFSTIEKDSGQYNEPREIFWASGACLFIKAKIFKQAGMFDGDFFAHMEEIDLCWRLKNAGHKIYYYPDATVYHVGGATLDKASAQKTFLNFRNNLSLVYKNVPSSSLNSVLMKRVFLDAAAAVSFIFSGGFSHFWAVVRAYKAFWASRPKNRKKRKGLKQQNTTCIYQKSIVKAYYVNKKRLFSSLKESDFS